ncbi:MAG: DUF3679 domain-containing protein [Bacillaceae bacterium]|nr:DUF3679 domain-containing protein [Bacillaceae bacterium]
MKLAFQFFFLVSILLFGVLLGIDTAEKGIRRIDGNPGASGAFHIKRVDGNRIELEVLGQTIVTDRSGNPISQQETEQTEPKKEPVIPQEQAEPAPRETSWLSRIGNQLGDWLSTNTRRGLEWLITRMSS